MKETTIDMSKYVESHDIHEKCAGCSKVFDYTPAKGEITSQKCLAYVRPAIWWEEKHIAMKKKLVVSKAHPKGIWAEVPAVIRVCPLATHTSSTETVKDQGKIRVGQQKQRGK